MAIYLGRIRKQITLNKSKLIGVCTNLGTNSSNAAPSQPATTTVSTPKTLVAPWIGPSWPWANCQIPRTCLRKTRDSGGRWWWWSRCDGLEANLTKMGVFFKAAGRRWGRYSSYLFLEADFRKNDILCLAAVL